MLAKLQAFLDGKKTYIIAILVGIGGVLTAFHVAIPDYVWTLLGALGLGAVRSAIDNQQPKV